MHVAHSPTFPSLHLRHSSFSNPSVALPTLQIILQPFRCFTCVTAHSPTLLSLLLRHSRAHSPTFPSLYLRYRSFSNPSVASPTSQLILQPFRRLTYVTAHSPTLLSPHICHSSFSNPFFASPTSQQSSFSNLSITSPTSQLILQPFRRFTYVTDHSPTFPSLYVTDHSQTLPLLHLRHSSFSNPSFASPTSQALYLRHLASRPLYCRTQKVKPRCFLNFLTQFYSINI